MNLTSMERRWALDIWDAIYPGGDKRLRVGIKDLDAEAFLLDFARSMPPLAVLGLRVAIVVIALAPLVVLRRLCTIHGLRREERLGVLARLYASDNYFVRSFVTLVKATGALLYAGTQGVRQIVASVTPDVEPAVPLARIRRMEAQP